MQICSSRLTHQSSGVLGIIQARATCKRAYHDRKQRLYYFPPQSMYDAQTNTTNLGVPGTTAVVVQSSTKLKPSALKMFQSPHGESSMQVKSADE